MSCFRFFSVIAFFCLLILKNSFSQDTTEERVPLFWIGAYADYNYNIHTADFLSLPNCPTCSPKYSNGSGSGFALGVLSEIQLVPSINLAIRLGYSGLSGLITEQETAAKVMVKDPATNQVSIQDLIIKHTIDSKIHSFGIEPTVSFKFIDRFVSHVGFRISYLASAKFDKSETITSPNNIVFLDGRTVRNDSAGLNIPELNAIQFFGVFGLGYEFPIGKESYLIPEIRYALPFTNLSSVNWKPSSLQFGLSLKIPIYPKRILPIIQDTIYQRDTTIIAVLGQKVEAVRYVSSSYEHAEFKENDVIVQRTIINEHFEKKVPKSAPLSASIDVTGVSKDSSRSPNPLIVIEETEMTEGFPLLPQVFFKPGSSRLEETSMHLLKSSETNNFKEQKLKWNSLEIYNDLLNIAGARLLDNPNAVMTITGCNSNTGIESNNLNLSEARAQAVKNYLTSVWNVNPEQIKIKKQNNPDIPGNITEKDGIEENQRAELSSDNFEVLKPVNLQEIQRTANPPLVEISPYVITDVGVKSWELAILQEGKVIRRLNGADVPKTITWKVEDEPMPKLETPVNISFTAIDDIDQKVNSSKTLSMQQITIREKRVVLKNDTVIEKFSLIVFDFNKADLTSQQKTIVEKIKQRIKPNSRVIISGYTDRTGEKEYNRELAHRRTLEVQKILKVNDLKLTLNPIGNDLLLYDNDSPQGRSYCRTVQIMVETPIKE